MLRYFFDIRHAEENRQLFNGTLIEQAKTAEGKPCIDEQGQYPTIMLTVKGVRPRDYADFIQQMIEKVAELYRGHRYLLESDYLHNDDKQTIQSFLDKKANISELRLSLKNLTEYLHKHHRKKVMLFMDEYDTPIHSAYLSKTPFHQELCDFMKIFMGEAFKDNEYLKKGLITGILSVGMMDLFSGLNSIATRSMMTKKYEAFFGFTETETEAFVTRHSTDLNEAELTQRLADIKDWYNGYNIGETLLYNPWSIIQYLNNEGELAPYWNASGESSLLGNALLKAQFNVKARLIQLLTEDSIQAPLSERTLFADLHRSEGALWHMLLSSGYLKILGKEKVGARTLYTLAIPNKELTEAYQHMVENWFLSIGEDAYYTLFESLGRGDLKTFAHILKTYLEATVSCHDLGPKTLEKYYHVLILGMFFVLQGQYTIASNKEGGYGRYDMVLTPQDKEHPAYVFEFKASETPDDLEKDAQLALDQIKEKKYDAELKQAKMPTITHIGIAFCGKHMHLVHRAG